MAWNDNLYTVDYGQNQWIIAKLIGTDKLSYHFEDSRGNRTIIPAHNVTKLTKRNSW
jgi:hypothetical protein